MKFLGDWVVGKRGLLNVGFIKSGVLMWFIKEKLFLSTDLLREKKEHCNSHILARNITVPPSLCNIWTKKKLIINPLPQNSTVSPIFV